MRIIVDAYGLYQTQRHHLLFLLAPRTRSMVDFLAAQAAAGTQPWTRLWQDSRGRAWRADTTYIEHRLSHRAPILLH